MAFREPQPAPFAALTPPYRRLVPIDPSRVAEIRDPGSALVWDVGSQASSEALAAAAQRPPGTALLAMLPAAEGIGNRVELFRLIERARPHSVLPHHEEHSAQEWAALLSRTPPDLPAEVIDYLTWSGVAMDTDTRHLARRVLELSAELRTVSALARSLYLSRRALGRRFMIRGLPVPSHWLHFGRVLRAALRLQSSSENLFRVASSLGYPDGFALSNQMHRLTGVRPTQARECRGWEWMVQAWMDQEGMGPEGEQGTGNTGEAVKTEADEAVANRQAHAGRR